MNMGCLAVLAGLSAVAGYFTFDAQQTASNEIVIQTLRLATLFLWGFAGIATLLVFLVPVPSKATKWTDSSGGGGNPPPKPPEPEPPMIDKDEYRRRMPKYTGGPSSGGGGGAEPDKEMEKRAERTVAIAEKIVRGEKVKVNYWKIERKR